MLRTERLILRHWKADDIEPFVEMNADPRVMEYFPSTMTNDATLSAVERIESHFAKHRFGLWAVEIPPNVAFAGFIGLNHPRFDAHFTPCVEIAWRLKIEYWGFGYATEGARAAIAFGFRELQLKEIVAMTVPANQRSRRVMEKLQMRYDPRDDFDHPLVDDGSPLKRHLLYRVTPAPSY